MSDLNVMDFGAVGDGEANDTEAIQRAVLAAKPGDRVLLGHHRVEESIKVPFGVTLVGGHINLPWQIPFSDPGISEG